MTLGFNFHPEAQAEFDADIDRYDDGEFGVGGRFAGESPETWAKWPDWNRDPTVRSKGVVTFPYRTVYFVQDDRLVIVAVALAKRRPGYWRGRVSPR